MKKLRSASTVSEMRRPGRWYALLRDKPASPSPAPGPSNLLRSSADRDLQGASTATKDTSVKSKKDEPPQELTPLEKMLQNAGPLRADGSDKFFGLENVRCDSACPLF